MPDKTDRLPLTLAIKALNDALDDVKEDSPAEGNIKAALNVLTQMYERLPQGDDDYQD